MFMNDGKLIKNLALNAIRMRFLFTMVNIYFLSKCWIHVQIFRRFDKLMLGKLYDVYSIIGIWLVYLCFGYGGEYSYLFVTPPICVHTVHKEN